MKIASFFINDIAAQTGGTIQYYQNNALVQQIVYDTRSLFVPGTALFIAIDTGKRNGHHFIADAYAKGIRNFLVDQDIAAPGNDINVIRVKHVITALHQWASAHRATFKSPVVAITGSNGKTTLKEWLNTILSPFFVIARSPRSFNSQLGVPLSLLQLDATDKLALIEVGISKPGEMETLAKMVKPDIAIITNVEQAHAVNFNSHGQHIAEKLVLARYASVFIYDADDAELAVQAKEIPCIRISWGFEAGLYHAELNGNRLAFGFEGKTIEYTLNVFDKGSVQNICHAIACTFALGIDPVKVQQQVKGITPVEMRFELKEGINNCKILNDTYSLDYYSFQLAVEYVGRNAGELNKTVIVSDFPEITSNKEAFYSQLGKFLSASGIHKVVGIGRDIQGICPQYKGTFAHYISTDAFISQSPVQHFKDELILIKGSRQSQFENIVAFFDLKRHATYLKVDLAAIQHNLNYYQSLLKPGTKTMVMVKALAYGSGSREISHLLEFNKVDYLAVAYADEGVELRKLGIRLPIMVMNPDDVSFSVMVQYNLQPEIYNLAQFDQFVRFLKLNEKENYPIHIKLDTGMHRLGFGAGNLPGLTGYLSENRKYVRVESIFSHLAAADDPQHDAYTLEQVSRFEQHSNIIMQQLDYVPLRHILNSPGIERFGQFSFDMVRLGIGLHGIAAVPEIQQHLVPVHTLVSKISHIQELHTGQTVGYGRKGKINGNRRIAVVPIGYADGYFRWFSNGVGKVQLHGMLAPVVGNVCMDMIMIDITDISHTQMNNEVIIFGPSLPVWEVAAWVNTIPYELLTSVSTRVKRVYIDHV